ncbi:MAG: hypothetical protein EOP85_21735, partial [Verrucomicrobiaceae bacterium]
MGGLPDHDCQKNRVKNLLPFLLLLSLTGTASANAGTPMMWASSLHLLFGNLVIGFLEGFIIASFFGRLEKRTLLVM